MSLTQEEIETIKVLKAQGKSEGQVKAYIAGNRNGLPSSISLQRQEEPQKSLLQKFETGASKVTGVLGLDSATQVFGDTLARTGVGAALTGANVDTNRQFIEAPTGQQLAGAALQTASVAAAPAIAPAGLVPAMFAGGALGYAYDVGSDLATQKSLTETLTPGVGTAVGVIAPPVIKGAFGLAGRLGGGAATNAIGQAADNIAPGTVANAVPESAVAQASDAVPAVVKEAVSDVGARFKRVGERTVSAFEERAATAERLKTATPAVREAVKTQVDDVVIDLATNSDQSTKDALKKMVQLAEQPKTARPTAGPASVASDVAVDQYKVIESQRKNIGAQIGKLSDELPNLKSIDVTPTQNNVINVLEQNGIGLDIDGKLAANDNMKVSDEQLAVLNKIWQKITSRQQMSAKNLHELDQWFSGTQRSARSVDKVEDLYIKVPTADGEANVPIYKFFRDAFGQRLDEVAPENLRSLNQQYRQLSNLTDDVEATLVKNSKLETLANSDISNPASLRRMFGEAQSAEDFRLIYEQMDAQSRQLGFDGPRADELYYFANKIRDYYPETIPDTGLRKNIFTSIQDVVGSAFEAGKADTKDQQKALRMLLELE